MDLLYISLVHTKAGYMHKLDTYISLVYTKAGYMHKLDTYLSLVYTKAGYMHKLGIYIQKRDTCISWIYISSKTPHFNLPG